MIAEIKRYDSGSMHHITTARIKGVTPRDLLAIRTACVEFVSSGRESKITREIERADGETVVVFRSDSGVAQLRFGIRQESAEVITIDHNSPPRQLRIPSDN